MRGTSTLILALGLAGAACRDKTRSASTAPDAAERAVASASSAQGRSVKVAPDKMRGCPVTVSGALTAIIDVAGGIQLIVTTARAADAAEIQKRGQHLLEMVRQAADPGAGGDAAAKRAARAEAGSGRKEGTNGLTGVCPVMWADARLAVTNTPAGATFTLTPEHAEDVSWLRRQTRERFHKLETGEAP